MVGALRVAPKHFAVALVGGVTQFPHVVLPFPKVGAAETVGQVHKVFAVHFGLFKQLAGPRKVLAVQGQILEDLFFKAVGILAVKLLAQRLALFQGDLLVADLLCMVLSIQAKRSRTWPGKWEAYYDNGRAHSGYDVVEWAKRGVALGAGEILLMSVDNEGLQRGMDLELIEAVTKAVNVPVICGGGVGCGDDIVDGARAGADAVACAAVLHYKKETVQELKDDIRAGGVEVRRV